MSASETDMNDKQKIEWALFLLRLGIFIVMFIWVIEKFINPDHLVRNLAYFYYTDGVSETISYIVGTLELIVVLAFLAGLWKRYTYGIVMIAHGLSTFVSWKQYTPIAYNIVFFTAWPILAACIALYMLRHLDVKYTLKS
jgi:putative oxidoreductase